MRADVSAREQEQEGSKQGEWGGCLLQAARNTKRVELQLFPRSVATISGPLRIGVNDTLRGLKRDPYVLL